MIAAVEIEKRRSPTALREFVINLKDNVRANKVEMNYGIFKKGLYKEFLDEIVPLSLFSIKMYPDSYLIQPVLGSQGYDALVFNESVKQVDKIEMTVPQNGQLEANDSQLVVEKGHGEVQIVNPGNELKLLIPEVISVCKKKAAKDYSDCTLIIAIEPLKPFPEFELNYENQINELISTIRQFKFTAKRVFLFVMPDRIVLI
ncbi:MAG: hypothetical protein WDA22_17335 [Bacteroidota bacterium]